MTIEPLLYETHMHTPLCKHAYGEPETYAAVAEEQGLKGIIVTCHNPINEPWGSRLRMRLEEFETYLAMVERARQAWAGRIDVRLGLESDYAPGMEPWLEDLHNRADFHYILGSVHPQLDEYKKRYFNGDVLAFQHTYFEHLAMAAETGLFDTLSHPDIIKIVHPNQWRLDPLLDHIGRCLDRVAATGIAMELNTSGLQKVPAEMNPGPAILTEMQRRNIPVVVGADAHVARRVAADFEKAFDMLQQAGYTQVSIFLNRERQDIDIDLARQSLRSSVPVTSY